jgi:hypothetical protein
MKIVFPHPLEGKHNLIFIIKLCIFWIRINLFYKY